MPIRVSATRVRDRSTVEPDSPVPGWLRTAANTGLAAVGVDAGSLPTYSGSLTVSSGTIAGQVINVGTGTLTLSGTAVVDRCRIVGAGTSFVISMAGSSALTHCDLYGSDSSQTGILTNPGSTTTITSVNATGIAQTLWADGGGTVTDFYGHAYPPEVGQGYHRDGFTRRNGVEALTVSRSCWTMDQDWTTAACFMQDTWSTGIGGVSFEDCLFDGVGNNILLQNAQNMRFTNCRCRPRSLNGVSSYGAVSRQDQSGGRPATSTDAWSVWLYDAGDSDYKGSAVTDPA